MAEEIEQSIYETSDLESIEQPDPVVAENEDIIESTIEFDKSFGRFNNEFVDGKVNFNYVSNMSLKDSGFRAYQAESTDQKLSRIRRELYEVQEAEKTSEMSGNIDDLIELAKNSDLKSSSHNRYRVRVKELFDQAETSTRVDAVDAITPSGFGGVGVESILEVEKKVSELEEKLADVNTPISNQINDLTRKLNIVSNPEYNITQAQKDITRLLESPEVARFHTSNTVDNYKNDKINALVQHLPDLDQYISTSSRILERLRALNDVHLSSIETHDFAANFHTLFNSLSEEVDNWDKSLKHINDKLDGNIDSFEKNKEAIRVWVDELTNKVEAIQKEPTQKESTL